MKPVLLILTGNIGSGKSTVCRKARRHNFFVCGRDYLRKMIGGGAYWFDTAIEPIILEMEMHVVEALMHAQKNIVIDEVGMTFRGRAKYIDLARQHDYYAVSYRMRPLSMRTCIRRRMKAPHGRFTERTWERVWKMFDQAYVRPTKTDGFSHVLTAETCKDPFKWLKQKYFGNKIHDKRR